ncbi:BEL1-like homeodomain protein 8 [Linum perenne]
MTDESSLHYYYTTSSSSNPNPPDRANFSEFVTSNPFSNLEFGYPHQQPMFQAPTRHIVSNNVTIPSSTMFNIEGCQDVELLSHPPRQHQHFKEIEFATPQGLSLSLASNNMINRKASCGYNGPLGPFTGYATILKSSRFLKPAQELMEQWCGGNSVMGRDAMTELGLGFVRDFGVGGGGGGCGGSSHELKAKLSYLHEEVCKRYKVYNQQIEMVVSSFESVAGIGSSTPYVSLAIKSVSRKFKWIKQVISDQLKHVTKVLGDQEHGQSQSQPFVKQIGGPSGLGFFQRPEAQKHVYRSQRGLPERSVAILRAWLFEHFLHPYPTDVDKQYLATQTGLTRNQVSNWFINARVRIWKPMVDEIHKLENNNVDHPGPNSIQHDNYHGFGTSSSIGHDQQHQKRSRLEFFQVPMNHGNSVSLTLGLRHGFVDNVSQHQQRLQEHEDRLRREFGGGYGGMVHDFGG